MIFKLRSKLPDEEREALSSSQREICQEMQRKSFQINIDNNNKKDGVNMRRTDVGEYGKSAADEANVDLEEQCRTEERRREHLLGELIRYRWVNGTGWNGTGQITYLYK